MELEAEGLVVDVGGGDESLEFAMTGIALLSISLGWWWLISPQLLQDFLCNVLNFVGVSGDNIQGKRFHELLGNICLSSIQKIEPRRSP